MEHQEHRHHNMITLYPDIKTKNWQISTAGVGVISEGLADIRQCLDILLRTAKGSDPLRPDFGSDIYQYVDTPLTIAIPNVMRAIIEATQIWEKRVTIRKINYEIQDLGHVKFTVTYALVDEELIDLLVFYLNGGYLNYDPVDSGALTLYALFPANPNNKRYTMGFTANGETIIPLPPPAGFTSINALFNWVIANWGGYGTWQLGADRITLFASPSVLTGSLAMSLTGTLRFAANIPDLSVGEDYVLNFVPDVSDPQPPVPSSFASMGEMLTWVQANWGQYGTWAIEGNPYGPGDFDVQDFDEDDFEIGSPSSYLLVLYTDVINNCVLEVTPI